MSPTPRHIRGRRRGYTLIELVVAMTAGSVIIVAMGGALTLASFALPTADEPAVRIREANDALSLIARDVAVASGYSITGSKQTLVLTLPDRDDSDGADTVRYDLIKPAGEVVLIRSNGAYERHLITGVGSFQVDAITPADRRPSLLIELTIAGPPDVTATTTVEMLANPTSTN
ncbi:MAG: hypothetical protein CMJ31_05170 [Phycisphaerae bacterium]|nr:hypothetical protein [Phycisphaerae bacterium]